jgi:hypothetical protein
MSPRDLHQRPGDEGDRVDVLNGGRHGYHGAVFLYRAT